MYTVTKKIPVLTAAEYRKMRVISTMNLVTGIAVDFWLGKDEQLNFRIIQFGYTTINIYFCSRVKLGVCIKYPVLVFNAEMDR